METIIQVATHFRYFNKNTFFDTILKTNEK